MAIKGLAYPKTTWAFEERPVASSKLNNWDDRIEAALELAYFLLAHAWGGGDGVIRGATANDLKVTPHSPEDLSVDVNPGYAFISKAPFKLANLTPIPDVTPPGTNPRKDLVQARLGTWDITVKQGTQSATPVAPAPDADAIPLAELYLRPGMTTIRATDNGTDGYIIDLRPFV